MDVASSSSAVGTRLEPRRLVGIAYVVFAAAAGMFLSHILSAVFAGLRWNDPQLLGIEDLTVTSLLGFVLAIGTAVALWMTPKVQGASLEVATELKKVTWPSFAETRVSTVAVIIASLVSSIILFVFDFLASKIMTVWVPGILGWLARL